MANKLWGRLLKLEVDEQQLESARPSGPRLNYFREPWPLIEDICPCDSDFVGYLTEKGVGGESIFHFGTGEHHLVGTANSTLPEPNDVWAITASPAEHGSYMDLIIESPHVARHYKVVFGDIYTFKPQILPSFDIVTLFHLCEYYTEANAAYAPLDDAGLLQMFLKRLKPGGKLLFYGGSWGFGKASKLLKSFVADGRLFEDGQYKSLHIYRPGCEAAQRRVKAL